MANDSVVAFSFLISILLNTCQYKNSTMETQLQRLPRNMKCLIMETYFCQTDRKNILIFALVVRLLAATFDNF